MTMLKAIETRYKGYRFRSRLEARWAVFFDALSIKWQYELEGFDLGEHGWYLPDFWVADWSSYIEIKPVRTISVDERFKEDRKLCKLNQLTQRMVILLEGSPFPDEYSARAYRLQQCWGGWLGETEPYSACTSDLIFQGNEIDEDTLYLRERGSYEAYLGEYPDGTPMKWESFYQPRAERLMTAFEAARSARFEHGESG